MLESNFAGESNPGDSGVTVQVSLVINYDLPASLENYLHRIGPAGCTVACAVVLSILRVLGLDF